MRTRRRDVAAGCLHFDRHRDRVAVVLDEEQHRQLLRAGGVERFPELAFARRALAERDVRDLVAVDSDTRDPGSRERGCRCTPASAAPTACSTCVPVGLDPDTMFSAVWPQCDGICRPRELGSSLAPTAARSISSGVTPSCRQSARSR